MKLPKRSPRSRRRRALGKVREGVAKVPGPSNNPATNLLIADVAMRGATLLIGRQLEKTVLRTRYDPDKAADIVAGRTFAQSMAANGAARVATRSLPGFLAVSGGLLAKALFDRTFSRRESEQKAEEKFAEQAANAPDKS